jgi:TolB protein
VKTIAALLAVVAVAAATTAGAAPAPTPRSPEFVTANAGWMYVGDRRVVQGAQPSWSPDGRRIAYVRNGEVRVVDATGRNARRLTRNEPGLHWPANTPAWSPDGKRIAFSGTRDVFTISATGGKPSNLTRAQESWRGNFTPSYSPDGQTLAFARSTDAFNSDIFLMDVNGRHLRRLTTSQGTHDTQGEEAMPEFSPDGKTIVFMSNRDGDLELYSIGVDGSDERRLTRTRAGETFPRFRPDGERLVYAHNGKIASMSPDGTGVRELGRGSTADWR